jgi:hypothetical protein
MIFGLIPGMGISLKLLPVPYFKTRKAQDVNDAAILNVYLQIVRYTKCSKRHRKCHQ